MSLTLELYKHPTPTSRAPSAGRIQKLDLRRRPANPALAMVPSCYSNIIPKSPQESFSLLIFVLVKRLFSSKGRLTS